MKIWRGTKIKHMLMLFHLFGTTAAYGFVGSLSHLNDGALHCVQNLEVESPKEQATEEKNLIDKIIYYYKTKHELSQYPGHGEDRFFLTGKDVRWIGEDGKKMDLSKLPKTLHFDEKISNFNSDLEFSANEVLIEDDEILFKYPRFDGRIITPGFLTCEVQGDLFCEKYKPHSTGQVTCSKLGLGKQVIGKEPSQHQYFTDKEPMNFYYNADQDKWDKRVNSFLANTSSFVGLKNLRCKIK